jgi:hypothetical protein
MKHIIITFLFTINLLISFGQDMTKEQQKAVSDFIDCIKNQRKEELASKVSYPFNREYPIPPIKNAKEFLERYDEVFDKKLIEMIVKSDPAKDWSAVGWRGIMLLNGELWLDENGKLIAVNHQSNAEAKKNKKLVKTDKKELHESIKKFRKPVLVMETSKFRVRVDDLGEGNYRYASWKLESEMSEKPDLIIENGKFIAEGTGGNHKYEFVNGDYKYECDIVVLGEKNSPPAYLNVYKKDKEILSQRANLMTE